MHVEGNGTRLWFDVDGPALVPNGPEMRERPTVVLVHGGPGSYDHSYFKPDFARLAGSAQVVYLDLRGHGRSAWGDPADWSFEVSADDLRGFCDALGIARPVVYGHSMGGFIAMLYGRATLATHRRSCSSRRWRASTWRDWWRASAG
jgi:pimeloyl-ACP methyl ester carboxylesterase